MPKKKLTKKTRVDLTAQKKTVTEKPRSKEKPLAIITARGRFKEIKRYK